MFGKNLKYYRLKNNMTKKELADACGISSMAISYYENDKRKPDIDIIKKLAEALGLNVADFIQSRNKKVVVSYGEFRKTSKLSKAQQELVYESVEEYFSRFFDAIDCLCGDPLPEPLGCHKLTLSDKYQENAYSLKKYLRLAHSGPVDELVSVLENLGIFVIEIDIDNDGFSGMNGTVNRYPYIVINKNMRPERKRTTIVHELAHIMFLWDEITHENAESMATAIAGAFLISDEDMLRELGPRRTKLTKDLAVVCEAYGISMYLLVKRANQLNIMTDSLVKDFYIKANKAKWKTNEPLRVKKPEEPMLFKQFVYRAINEEGISIEKGAELLRIPVTELRKFCGIMEVFA